MLESLDTEHQYVMTLEKQQVGQQSRASQSRFHAVLNQISNETGQPMDQLKEEIKKKYIGSHVKIVDGKEIETGISTTTLSTNQINDLTNQVIMWANDFLDMNIPLDRR